MISKYFWGNKLGLVAMDGSRYTPGRTQDPLAMTASLAIVGGVIAAIALSPPHLTPKLRHEPMVVELMQLPAEPPPAAEPRAEHKQKHLNEHRKTQRQPEISQPTPVLALPVSFAASTVPDIPKLSKHVATQNVSTPQPVSRPADGGDLSTRMLSANPPHYPAESRRRREEGTVVLHVLLSEEGRVEEISVAESSGFFRLDKAALRAVRHWRWSPLVRNGAPVMVQGLVTIPFVLQA